MTEQHRESARMLNDAIAAGDIEKVITLIDGGICVNEPDSLGQLPMFVAIRRGRADVVQLLIERGADVNTPLDRHGRRPLYYAADHGHVNIVEYLIANGATIDALENHGQSALWASALSLANESLNVTNRASWRSIQNRNPTGRVAVVEMLIAAGADVNLPMKDSNSPADFIRTAGIPRLIALLEMREKRSFRSRLFGRG
jgi:ankyrin repeat protein